MLPPSGLPGAAATGACQHASSGAAGAAASMASCSARPETGVAARGVAAVLAPPGDWGDARALRSLAADSSRAVQY